jgi:hypothetical protein
MESSLVYHEAGHAVMAAFLGAEVLHVTVEPDRDEGPDRDGDAAVRWYHRGISRKELARRELMAALAGPVAEMIHAEESCEIHQRREWAADYAIARELATTMGIARSDHHRMIQAVTHTLLQEMAKNNFWQAIAEVADLLDAHETIEGDMVSECVQRWVGTS